MWGFHCAGYSIDLCVNINSWWQDNLNFALSRHELRMTIVLDITNIIYDLVQRNFQRCSQVAYRRWICSELVPFYVKGGQVRIPPCLRLCQDVEQQCPYLLPDQTLTPSEAAHPTPQYAGEPNFLCLDPNIPRLEERPNSTGDEDCCYTHCGAPGRGRPADLYSYVCDRCPSRPTNGTQGSTTEIEEENRRRSTATGIGTPTSGTRTSIGPVSWWMWWTFLILTLRAGARLNDLINFFIVGTANSVRTVPECGC
ncbi:hypothetical protein ABEB36_003501 [Hypothenemus hampei]|uniref:Uncharacterized protein n=1 Tax=Hypothenemus hampei TaxID=57062 RepID=A0ABD1F9D6_HYPHA